MSAKKPGAQAGRITGLKEAEAKTQGQYFGKGTARETLGKKTPQSWPKITRGSRRKRLALSPGPEQPGQLFSLQMP